MTDETVQDDLPHADASVEIWQFDAWSEAHELGLWVEFGWRPHARLAWYAAVLTPREGPVTLVVDPDISLATLSPSAEFRAEGIWAQHVCEDPLVHWTVGLEAFGVHLDQPADAARDQWGTRAAVGLDVEWETSSEPERHDGGLLIPSSVHGEVLIDDRSVDFAGHGRRTRWWSSDDNAAPPDLGDEPGQGTLAIPVRIACASGDRWVRLGLSPSGVWGWRRGG